MKTFTDKNCDKKWGDENCESLVSDVETWIESWETIEILKIVMILIFRIFNGFH